MASCYFRLGPLADRYPSFIMAVDRPAPYHDILPVAGAVPIAKCPTLDQLIMTTSTRGADTGNKRRRDAVFGAVP